MQVTSARRILEDVLPLRIIREVEKWPVIYKKNSPEMSNPHFKYKIWEEVAKNLFENYEIYSAAEKHGRVTCLIKKWRNLRDTFKRQLLVEKKIRAGHKIKRKEYVYFKQMSFLLPHMTEEREEPAREVGPAQRARHAVHDRRRRARPSASPPPAPLDPIEHIDEDKHFLLSLLPSFKRMNEDEKLTAKMEILKVIKDVKNSSMALEFVVDDALALEEQPPDDAHDVDDVVVKQELLTVEVQDYKSASESAGGDTD